VQVSMVGIGEVGIFMAKPNMGMTMRVPLVGRVRGCMFVLVMFVMGM
jgi:hypothetical protein